MPYQSLALLEDILGLAKDALKFSVTMDFESFNGLNIAREQKSPGKARDGTLRIQIRTSLILGLSQRVKTRANPISFSCSGGRALPFYIICQEQMKDFCGWYYLKSVRKLGTVFHHYKVGQKKKKKSDSGSTTESTFPKPHSAL